MTIWLANPATTNIGEVIARHEWEPCPASYSADSVRHTSRGENGDALRTVPEDISTFRVYEQMPLTKVPPSLMLRTEVVARLRRANTLLPPGLSLTVLDGWRSLAFQQELLDYYAQVSASVVSNMYVSDPADLAIAPPHVTGGAVDLTLEYKGTPLALGTDFDAFERRADLDWFEKFDNSSLTDEDILSKNLRRCFSDALSRCGFAHYPREWWHWSYGDQWWAACYRHSMSVYSEVA